MPDKGKLVLDRDKVSEALNNTSPSDFDGHTEFNALTPEQKLMWLSQCAQFVWETRGENRDLVEG